MGQQLPSFRQGWAEVYTGRVRVNGDNVRYAEKSVKAGELEKGRESKKSNHAGDRARGVVCDSCPVFKKRAGINGMSMRNSGHRVERSGIDRCPMAKASSRKLTKQTKSLKQREG